MPLWRIFSHPSTFSAAQKQAFVESITSFYTRGGLPAFYVDVIFIPVEPDSFYVSGRQAANMVRIAVEHLAVHQPKLEDDTQGRRVKLVAEIDKVLSRIATTQIWHIS